MTSGLGNAALVGLIAIVPVVLLMLTSFVKISVVLSLLRNAIGAPDAPSGLVVIGLALILTFFVMAPVAIEMVHAAAAPAAGPTAPPTRGAPVPTAPPTRGAPVPSAPPTRGAPVSTAPPTRGAPGPSGATGSSSSRSDRSSDAKVAGAVAVIGAAPAGAAVGSGAAPAGAAVGSGAAPAGAAVGSAAAPAGAAVGRAAAPVEADRGVQATPAPATEVNAAGSGLATKPLDFEGAIRALVPAQYRPEVDAVARALDPLRGFLARHASPRDRETFTELTTRMGGTVDERKRGAAGPDGGAGGAGVVPRGIDGDELWVLAPAFLTTELREAFAIAVLIFVPFLVIDLVVGIGLAALGLSSTSPQAIALPLKLLLFVSVDGWRLLIDALLRGYV